MIIDNMSNNSLITEFDDPFGEDYFEEFSKNIEAYSEYDLSNFCENIHEKIRELHNELYYDPGDFKIPGEYSEIVSHVGDDSLITTDNPIRGHLSALFTETVGIKLSLSDVFKSHRVALYAKEIVLMPLNEICTFHDTSVFAKNSAIPYTLDPVQLKTLSLIRKQSEQDSPVSEKFSLLTEKARWVHPEWLTYFDNNIAVILMLGQSDLPSLTNFPFIFKTEGGSGGLPPWGNLDTAIGLLSSYRRGKSKTILKNIVKEAHEVFRGDRISSKRLLPIARVASLGINIANRNLGIKELAEEKGYSKSEFQEYMRFLEGITSGIPEDLVQKSIVIENNDRIKGSVVKRLRDSLLIKTELDVLTLIEDRKRFESIGGEVPYKEILKEIEENKRKIRRKNLIFLEEAFGKRSSPKGGLGLSLFNYSETRKLFSDYYTANTSSVLPHTSFSYQDELRIFKTSDVLDEFPETNNRKFVSSIFKEEKEEYYFLEEPRRATFKHQKILEREAFIQEWINKNPLSILLTGDWPVGVTTDDARIFFSVEKNIQSIRKIDKLGQITIILVSNDRGLGSTLNMFSKLGNVKVVMWNVQNYFNILNQSKASKWGTEIFNPVTNKVTTVPLEDWLDVLNIKPKYIVMVYDIPNIERTLFTIRALAPTYVGGLREWFKIRGGILTSIEPEKFRLKPESLFKERIRLSPLSTGYRRLEPRLRLL